MPRFVDRAGRTLKEVEMPPKASPAFPGQPQRFPDNRTAPRRDQERLEIQKQINHLKRLPIDQQRQRKVIERLVSGRKARRLPPFAELSIGRLPAVPALALQEFLVRKADLGRPDVQEVIKDCDLAEAHVAGLGGELVRLTLRGAVTFLDAATKIKNVPITPIYLFPAGGWIKGEGGPEPTAGLPEWRPPGETRIQVAVIDSGLGARTDDWLQGLENPEVDLLYPDPNSPDPDMPTLGLAGGHGTFVAGIVQRVEPSTDIRMYQGLDIDGMGEDITVGAKIEQAAAEGAQIINLSLGTQTVDDKPPPGIETGIRRAIEINNDILIVCSAGNYGDTRPVWPAAFSLTFPRNVVAVAGLNAQGMKPEPEWSSHGDFVQISTKGEGIVSTYVKGIEDTVVENPPDKFDLNAWAVWTGTSFAAPQIAGAVASICLDDKVEPTEAINTLKGRGEPIPDYGVGVEILPGT